jgi:signal transduction histidine kinase
MTRRFARLNDAPIRALYVDANNSLWIGTAGGGLFLWRNNRLVHFRREDGLPDDVISQITEDDSGRLWFGSRRGIFWIRKDHLMEFADGKTASFRGVILGKSEGLSGVYCLGACQPMAWKARNGELWFATQQGLLALNPEAMKPNAVPPPVYIDELLVNERPMQIGGAATVPPLPKKIEFRFTALSFAGPEKVRLRYRLDGVDSDWIESAGPRSATYGRLPPGDYRMRVTAANNDGVWNTIGAQLALTIVPAWWQTWTFRAAMVVLFSGVLAFSVRHWSQRRLRLKLERLEQQQALEKERARIARDLHDDLGASLTQIGLAAEMGRRESLTLDEVKQQSAQLASRVRSLARELDAIVWTVNPRNDSLDKLASYLCQFSQEFCRGSSMRCRLDVAENIPPLPVTPEVRHDLYLVTKEALNNAIKHSGATEVWLRVRVVNGSFEIKIEDNGSGFTPEAMVNSDRNGLRNMRSRIEELGGEFQIRSAMGAGTTVELRIPVSSKTRRTGNHSIER